MAVLWLLVAVAVLLAVAWLALSWHFDYWTSRGVVSCNPFAWSGDRSGVLSLTRPAYEALDPIYSKYKGKHRFVGSFQARQPVLVVLDPELAKTILTKDFTTFHSRGLPSDEDSPMANNLLFKDGARWKFLRSKLSPVFSSGKLKAMFPLVADVTDRLVQATREAVVQNGKEVDMKPLLSRYSTDVIGTVAFGVDCNSLRGGNDEFMDMAQRLFRTSPLFLVRLLLGSVHRALGRLIPMPRVIKETTDFFGGIVSDTVRHRDRTGAVRHDFVHLMMQLRDGGEEGQHRDGRQRFDHRDILGNGFLFFIAGLDNVSNTLGFALHELALAPALQQRVADEVVTRLAEHGGMNYEAVRGMALLERVLREALRKYTPLAVLTRRPSGPFQLPDSDVVIDETVQVMIPVWQATHDPEFFPEPQRFDPDRFLEDAKQARHPYAYLPFGEGPRVCIAERFVLLELKQCLAGLLRELRFSAAPRTDGALDPKTTNPSPKAGFWLRVEEREAA